MGLESECKRERELRVLIQRRDYLSVFKFKDDLTQIVNKNRADEENLEEHRFDANNIHSRLNLTVDNVANEIDIDMDMMDNDNPSKSDFSSLIIIKFGLIFKNRF